MTEPGIQVKRHEVGTEKRRKKCVQFVYIAINFTFTSLSSPLSNRDFLGTSQQANMVKTSFEPF